MSRERRETRGAGYLPGILTEKGIYQALDPYKNATSIGGVILEHPLKVVVRFLYIRIRPRSIGSLPDECLFSMSL